jgi:hypothetical protein
MDIFSMIAEDKIKRAMENGEFDHLPGKGKPLELEDLSAIPEDLRMAYTLLKNANMIDEIDRLKAELLTINDLLKACEDDDEKLRLKEKKNQKQIKFEELMNKRKSQEYRPSAFYKQKILDRLKNK